MLKCLFLTFFCSAVTQAQTLQWSTLARAHQAQFAALLHEQEGTYKITDPDFLGVQQIRPIDVVFSQNYQQYRQERSQAEYLCHFPARAFWFHQLENTPTAIDFSHCAQLSEFLNAVSNQQVTLVYASENLLSPSSFMGHTFLKFSKNMSDPGHSVSFFTNVTGFNVPKIMFDAIVVGKKGYFTVAPFRESKQFYTDEEGRNIYEYHLKLSTDDRLLLQLHLWELKDKHIAYFFHSHNCATLTLDILSIVEPKLRQYFDQWTTPLDVVKETVQSGIVFQTDVTPSLNWQIRTYGQTLPSEERQTLFTHLSQGKLSTTDIVKGDVNQDFIRYEYAYAANRSLHQSKEITDGQFNTQLNVLLSMSDRFDQYHIDLSDFKNPVKRPPDSQIGLTFSHAKLSDDRLGFSWLPASHLLIDNNQDAFSESSLEILHLASSISEHDIRLEKLTLYGIAMYIPYKEEVGGLSGKFALSWDRHDDLPIKQDARVNIQGAIGLSQSWHSHSLFYVTSGATFAANQEKGWIVPEFETGVFADLKFNTKLHAHYQLFWNDDEQSRWKQKSTITASYLGFTDKAVDFSYQYVTNGQVYDQRLNLSYRYYY